jgi:UDP-N-acetylglucosamine 1-carboxyvinyltransferase
VGSYIIEGGKRLDGNIAVSGSKNAVLPVLCATLLVDGTCVIKNCPRITDVLDTCRMLEDFGCKVKWEEHAITIDSSNVLSSDYSSAGAGKIRSSILFMGAELGRFKKASVHKPGGCQIGKRPVDMHIESFRELGVTIKEENDMYMCESGSIKGAKIRLRIPSVGTTENILILASVAQGETIIENAAREPEVCALADFINSCGGKISGYGTEKIVIQGVKKLHSTEFEVIGDRVEAGTFLCAAAGCGGDVFVSGNVLCQSEALIKKLEMCGCLVKGCDCGIRLISDGKIKPSGVKTSVYPAFPTDMQPQLMSVLTKADGISIITETVFEKRLGHAYELIKMGAKIDVKGNMAVICGVDRLYGAEVYGHDLRAGAGLIIAALMAEGKSIVHGSEYVKRGYENIEQKLRGIGASILFEDTGETDV